MVGHDKKCTTVRIGYSEHAILSDLYDCVGLWIDLLVDRKAYHTILYYPGAHITLTDHTQVVRCFPDASAVVSRRDRAIRVIDHLVSVFKLANNLSLTCYNTVGLRCLFLSVVGQDRGLLSEFVVADYSLLDVSIGHNLNNEAFLIREGHACALISVVIRVKL